MAPTSHTTTSWLPCPMRHCCPVGEAMEILGDRGGMSGELKQTRALTWVSLAPRLWAGAARVTASGRDAGVTVE